LSRIASDENRRKLDVGDGWDIHGIFYGEERAHREFRWLHNNLLAKDFRMVFVPQEAEEDPDDIDTDVTGVDDLNDNIPF
jgi:hypothetical protein